MSRVEIAKDQPDSFVMPGQSGPSKQTADVVFVRERDVDYLLYRAEIPTATGSHASQEEEEPCGR